jgi:hypothetical protein
MQASEQCNAWVSPMCYSTKACAVVLVIGLNQIAFMVISISEVGEFFNEFGISSCITSLLQSVASRADAFVRQHIPSQTPLSLLVLFPAAHDHCSIDFSSLQQALYHKTSLGDFHFGEVGWISSPFLYKADYGRICISTLALNSSFVFPLPQKLQVPQYHHSNNNSSL